MNSAQNEIPNLAAVAASFAPRAERKGWISSNWKWLSSMVLVVGFGLTSALAALAFVAIKNSDAAKESVLKAQANPLIVQKLGTPIAAFPASPVSVGSISVNFRTSIRLAFRSLCSRFLGSGHSCAICFRDRL